MGLSLLCGGFRCTLLTVCFNLIESMDTDTGYRNLVLFGHIFQHDVLIQLNYQSRFPRISQTQELKCGSFLLVNQHLFPCLENATLMRPPLMAEAENTFPISLVAGTQAGTLYAVNRVPRCQIVMQELITGRTMACCIHQFPGAISSSTLHSHFYIPFSNAQESTKTATSEHISGSVSVFVAFSSSAPCHYPLACSQAWCVLFTD